MFKPSNNPYDNWKRTRALLTLAVCVIAGLLICIGVMLLKGCSTTPQAVRGEGIESWGPEWPPAPHKRLLRESAEREKLRQSMLIPSRLKFAARIPPTAHA